jgi:CO/xanthine dehydrogenase FAD-binding subunit
MYQVVGYHRPTSLPEALRLVASHDRVALAGGVHLLHDGGATPTEVVDLQAMGFDSLDVESSSARLGAMVRLQAVVDDQRLPATIRGAAKAEQPSSLRTLATVGGTIATASGDSLLLAALLAHDSMVRLVSDAEGERSVSLSTLFAEGRRSGELITDVIVETSGRSAIARTGRTPGDTPIVGVVARRSEAGTTFGMCGVGETPIRLGSDQLGSLQPIDDHRATSTYRSHLVQVLTGRTLEVLS